MPRGLKKAGVLGVGDLGDADIEGLQADPVRQGLIGVAAGLVGGGAQQISAAGDQPEADALKFQGFLGLGGPAGQQQQAKQKAQARRFSSINWAASISRQDSKPLHMDHI